MKSSSRFFPARLVSAEVQGAFSEDVYLIKPNNSPDKKVEIAVTHLSPVGGGVNASGSSPVILLHSNYQNRRLWYSPSCDGLAKRLLAAGMDVWLMEARGHGLSPLNERFEQNTLGDYARYDLPAVNTFVAEQTKAKPVWLGCHEGAAALLLSVACGGLSDERTAAVVGLGQPLPQKSLARAPTTHLLPALLNGPVSYNVAAGPEREPMKLCRDLWRERSVFSYFGAQMDINVLARLSESDMPIAWLQAIGQASVSGLGALPALTSVLRVLPFSLPERLLGSESLAASMVDSQNLNALEAPLLHFLEGGIDGVSSAGKASSIA